MSPASVLTLVTGTRPSASWTICTARRHSAVDRRRCAARTSFPARPGKDLRVGDIHNGWNVVAEPAVSRRCRRPRRSAGPGARRRLSCCRRLRCAVPPDRRRRSWSWRSRSLTTATASLAVAFGDFPSPQHRNLHGREEPRPVYKIRVFRVGRPLTVTDVSRPALMSEVRRHVAHAGNSRKRRCRSS